MFIFCCCLLAIICIVVNWFSRKDKVVDNMPGPEYTKYLDWNGYYEGGWMDNGLLVELHPDYDFGAKCGTVEQDFRGNKSFGRIYYTGNSEFTFQIFNADGSANLYLVRPNIQDQEKCYTLDIFSMDGNYKCTFTRELTLEEYSKEYDWYMNK